MPKIVAGDIELYYEQHGAGVPLVLIPGFGTGLWIWFKQLPAFSKEFRTIIFDPRGISRSDAPDAPVTIRTIADDVAALLRALRIESAHILGASFGGFVAQELALGFPEMTRSLTLCCTSFGGPHHVPPSLETLQALASTKGLNTEERVRENLLLAFSPEFVERNRQEVEKVIELRAQNFVPEYAYLHQLQAALDFNAEDRVSEITAPTLVLTGDADIIVPVDNSRNLAARIAGARLVTIKGGSHTFFIEQADEFNAAIIKFIKETEAV
ncbi:MAG TPA: alpha/beta hydrolase [Pyrinomonadaceae bacterium]|jgi:pimeloyl-ACP methyl ester carboxylesterase|nr:alpha/beta hydrolase [Pyrinomonadaceae bacterium]